MHPRGQSLAYAVRTMHPQSQPSNTNPVQANSRRCLSSPPMRKRIYSLCHCVAPLFSWSQQLSYGSWLNLFSVFASPLLWRCRCLVFLAMVVCLSPEKGYNAPFGSPMPCQGIGGTDGPDAFKGIEPKGPLRPLLASHWTAGNPPSRA